MLLLRCAIGSRAMAVAGFEIDHAGDGEQRCEHLGDTERRLL